MLCLDLPLLLLIEPRSVFRGNGSAAFAAARGR